jgi:hypothetical protein
MPYIELKWPQTGPGAAFFGEVKVATNTIKQSATPSEY